MRDLIFSSSEGEENTAWVNIHLNIAECVRIPQVHSWESRNKESVRSERTTEDARGRCFHSYMHMRMKRMDAQDIEIPGKCNNAEESPTVARQSARNSQRDCLPALIASGHNVPLFHCLESCSLRRHTQNRAVSTTACGTVCIL